MNEMSITDLCQQAEKAGRKNERAAIVAFLRTCAGSLSSLQARAIDVLAADIERGEHAKILR